MARDGKSSLMPRFRCQPVPVPPAALCPFRRSGTLATLTTSQEPNVANHGRHGAELPLIHHMLTVAPGELDLTLGRHKIALAHFIDTAELRAFSPAFSIT
jgi:hypothetical protein